MKNSRTFTQTFSKLSDLVRKHYGLNINYRDEAALGVLSSATLADLERGNAACEGDSHLFPVLSKQKLIGAAEVALNDSRGLDSNTIARLQETIRLVLEAKAEAVEKIYDLKELEDVLYNNERSTNVVMLNDFRQQKKIETELNLDWAERQDEDEIEFIDAPAIIERANNTNLNFSFLIEGRNIDDLFKMALEIHHQSGRYAFLNISDLDKSTLESPESLRRLGGMTIFIPDITQLTFEQQDRLLAFLNSARDKDCPQIIAATARPISEVKRNRLVQIELIEKLMVGYLVIDTSRRELRPRDMVEFFFDRLTGRDGHPDHRLDV